MRKDKGITLIALVITIIILLILAGVTLNIALSENGLFSYAKRAVEEYENSSKKEDATLQETVRTMENLIQGTEGGNPSKPSIVEGVIGPTGKPLPEAVVGTEHETVHGEDSLGNPVVIPGGFKFAGKEGDTVENGIIVEDDEKNQFVWIPVSNINGDNNANTQSDADDLIKLKGNKKVEITLGRYTFKRVGNDSTGYTDGTPTLEQSGAIYSDRLESTKIGNYFYEDTSKEGRPNGGVGAKSLEDFVTSVETNHGYYIARYEAGRGSSNKPVSKGGEVWNNINQSTASTVARNMYSGEDSEVDYVESDLVNSYAWDTAIVYIQAMGNENYANANRDTNKNTELKNTGETGDVKCNIYDMAGNVVEWTTEYSILNDGSNNLPSVGRGGNCGKSNYCTAGRYSDLTTGYSNHLGFRPLLYLK